VKKLILTDAQYIEVGSLMMVIGLAEGMAANKELFRTFTSKAMESVNEEDISQEVKFKRMALVIETLTSMINESDTREFLQSVLEGNLPTNSISGDEFIRMGAVEVSPNIFEIPDIPILKPAIEGILASLGQVAQSTELEPHGFDQTKLNEACIPIEYVAGVGFVDNSSENT